MEARHGIGWSYGTRSCHRTRCDRADLPPHAEEHRGRGVPMGPPCKQGVETMSRHFDRMLILRNEKLVQRFQSIEQDVQSLKIVHLNTPRCILCRLTDVEVYFDRMLILRNEKLVQRFQSIEQDVQSLKIVHLNTPRCILCRLTDVEVYLSDAGACRAALRKAGL